MVIVRPGDTVVLAFDKTIHSDDLRDTLAQIAKEFQGLDIKFTGVSGLLESFIIRSDET